MKIVIAGAGEVGTHLAKMLSNENHDIVLMDDSPEKLLKVSSDVDLMTVIGSAHSFEDLKKTGLVNADLFIAVTPFEERNVWACNLADYLGVKRTIARINNSEYLKRNYKAKLNKLGINELIYPESLAAKEIIASIKQTGTRQLIEFSNEKLILMGIKVRDNATVINKSFEDLSLENDQVLVVAITRDGETIIPSGKDMILSGDVVFFITTRAEQQHVFNITGKELHDVKNIMFLGGSRIAQKTIEKLGENYRMKVIDNDLKRCERIADKYSNVLVINGDCRNFELLKEEGIEKVDAVIATTGNSETNILCCHLAKNLNIKRTIAEVENLAFMNLAYSMNVGAIINKKLIAASYIYRFTVNAEISKVKCLTATDAEVFEFIAKEGAKITKKPIKDLNFPEDAKIGGIIRNDVGSVAYGDTKIEPGDKVVIFTLPSAIRKLEAFFK